MTQFLDTTRAFIHWFDYEMSNEMWLTLVLIFTFFTALMFAVYVEE